MPALEKAMTDVKTKSSGRVDQLTKLSGSALGAITAAGEHLQKSSKSYEEGYALVTAVFDAAKVQEESDKATFELVKGILVAALVSAIAPEAILILPVVGLLGSLAAKQTSELAAWGLGTLAAGLGSNAMGGAVGEGFEIGTGMLVDKNLDSPDVGDTISGAGETPGASYKQALSTLNSLLNAKPALDATTSATSNLGIAAGDVALESVRLASAGSAKWTAAEAIDRGAVISGLNADSEKAFATARSTTERIVAMSANVTTQPIKDKHLIERMIWIKWVASLSGNKNEVLSNDSIQRHLVRYGLVPEGYLFDSDQAAAVARAREAGTVHNWVDVEYHYAGGSDAGTSTDPPSRAAREKLIRGLEDRVKGRRGRLVDVATVVVDGTAYRWHGSSSGLPNEWAEVGDDVEIGFVGEAPGPTLYGRRAEPRPEPAKEPQEDASALTPAPADALAASNAVNATLLDPKRPLSNADQAKEMAELEKAMTKVKTSATSRVAQLTKLNSSAFGAITAAGEHVERSSTACEEGYALVTAVFEAAKKQEEFDKKLADLVQTVLIAAVVAAAGPEVAVFEIAAEILASSAGRQAATLAAQGLAAGAKQTLALVGERVGKGLIGEGFEMLAGKAVDGVARDSGKVGDTIAGAGKTPGATYKQALSTLNGLLKKMPALGATTRATSSLGFAAGDVALESVRLASGGGAKWTAAEASHKGAVIYQLDTDSAEDLATARRAAERIVQLANNIMRQPVKDKYLIERIIWIRWIASLQGPQESGDKRHDNDVLDNDVIQRHLAAYGLVPAGYMFDADQDAAVARARESGGGAMNRTDIEYQYAAGWDAGFGESHAARSAVIRKLADRVEGQRGQLIDDYTVVVDGTAYNYRHAPVEKGDHPYPGEEVEIRWVEGANTKRILYPEEADTALFGPTLFGKGVGRGG